MNNTIQRACDYLASYKGSTIRNCCCPPKVGPTGPTGPQGPATIEVGRTIQGLPGSEASVINSGTNQNAILEFVIPAGATGCPGPTGPTGPRGATGPTGPTA